jgi:hypothetical protein
MGTEQVEVGRIDPTAGHVGGRLARGWLGLAAAPVFEHRRKLLFRKDSQGVDQREVRHRPLREVEASCAQQPPTVGSSLTRHLRDEAALANSSVAGNDHGDRAALRALRAHAEDLVKSTALGQPSDQGSLPQTPGHGLIIDPNLPAVSALVHEAGVSRAAIISAAARKVCSSA